MASKQVLTPIDYLRDDGGVSSRKGGNDVVLPSLSKGALNQEKIDQHVDWCRSRLRYIDRRSSLGLVEIYKRE